MSTTRPNARDGFVRGSQPGTAVARHSLFFVCCLGLLVLVALVQFGENGIFAFFNLRTREAELQQEVTDLELGIAVMDQQITALAEDPEALEKLVREKHNMRRSDEEVLLVLPPKEKD